MLMSRSAPHHSGLDQIPELQWIGRYLRSSSAVVEIRYHVSSCPSHPPKRFGSVVAVGKIAVETTRRLRRRYREPALMAPSWQSVVRIHMLALDIDDAVESPYEKV